MQQPFFAERTNVQIDTVERSQSADRVSAILQHARSPHRIWRRIKIGEPPTGHVLIELLIVLLSAGKRLLAPTFRMLQTLFQQIHGVHRAGIVDIVSGDKRGIEAAWPGGVEELPDKIVFLALPVKDPFNPKVLCADVGAEVLPLRIVGVRGRLNWIGPNMAKAARHSYAIGTHQILVVVVRRIGVIPFRIPMFGCFLIEVRVGEEPQGDDASLVAVIGPNGEVLAIEFCSARPNFYAGILLLVFEVVGLATCAPLVQPKAPSFGIGACRFFEAGIIHQAEVLPAMIATEVRVDLL